MRDEMDKLVETLAGLDNSSAVSAVWVEDAAEGLGIDLDEYVVLEWMPGYLRESHRAAGNWGVYPANGANRTIEHIAAARASVKADDDEYNSIVSHDVSPMLIEMVDQGGRLKCT